MPELMAIFIKMASPNVQGEFLIICLYVNDLLYTESSAEILVEFKAAMFNEFEMTDNGLMFYLLSIEVKQQQDVMLKKTSERLNLEAVV